MHRKIILAICLCNFAIAAVIPIEKDATILNYDYQNDGKGNYRFSFVTSNGIKRTEIGQLVNVGQRNEHLAVQGFYTFTDSDGKIRSFEYIADENGYNQQVKETTSTRSEEDIFIPVVSVSPSISTSCITAIIIVIIRWIEIPTHNVYVKTED